MPYVLPTNRRQILQRAGFGFGSYALMQMLAQESSVTAAPAVANPLAERPPHFPARAKHMIHIHLVGSPSHLDLFDPKPELQRRHGELCPDEMFEGKKFAFLRSRPTLFGTSKDWTFRKCGQSGIELSDLMPHLQSVADELCVVRSLHTDEFNHGPAQLFMLTGFGRFGRPSLGSWINYGLGTENSNLPGYVVLITGSVLGAGNSAWGSGFLPTVYQGVEFRSQGDPVLFLSNPPGIDRESRRDVIDTVNQINASTLSEVGDPEIATRIDQYEMAYRMQASVPELMEIESESQATHDAYGTTLRSGGPGPGKPSFANNCLLARRLVERGVRCVQLFDQGWDHHGNLSGSLPKKCQEVDRPVAALIQDLKQRGLLDETLVVWSAEFGRTPMAQGTNGEGKKTSAGRDHHRDAFTLWMAGGGTRPGTVYGRTDELGYSIAEDPVHVHDFNATLLHLMGLNHERLTYRHQGRQFRLTDVHGVVQRGLLA
ncbi:DUF1501 domain-containing protein [Roseiconus nitratireducens]|uniref:DUF1501 domain-containing protein n=1 Tax=Roseiconus nitratireducens TaxID=2605748 RepID=A0A5M6DHL3_9BACT|nr:DUF1501 domain-containing protein [Roseiconus nitratireducens]KAA5547034.1 DUF1501 domain-containing protein [Roseiconus nitratireducens]